MDTITREIVVPLAERAGWPLVSIYLPTHRLRIQTDPDRILLRNLLKDAHEALLTGGTREGDAEALLAEANAFAADDAEWIGGFDGLAMFISSEGTRSLKLDMPVPEVAIAGDRFYLRPLYRAFHGPEHFWALAIDLNAVRLFSGDRTNIQEVELPKGTPLSLADITQYDVREGHTSLHTTPGATPEGMRGDGSAMFFGHGGEKDAHKVERMQFITAVENAVTKTIGAECTDPLVLLGVDYLLADYREANSYSHLYGSQGGGATDYLEPRDVQATAWTLLEPHFAAATQSDVDELRQMLGTGHASEKPDEILAAAAAGRVKTLFFGEGSGPYGWFDRTNFDVTHLCEADPLYLRADALEAKDFDIMECGWDLVDLAAAETVLHRGNVHAFTGEDAPVGGVAAVYRY
jgi:hypothetical protein